MDLKHISEQLKKIEGSLRETNLPPELKQIAFSKIMDKLLESKKSKGTKGTNKGRPHKKNRKSFNKKKDDFADKIHSENEQIINSISRSKHVIIFKFEKAIDQSLYLLKIIEEEVEDIKELTPSQISKILRNIFKINKSSAAISMALMNAVKYTDRRRIIVNGSPAYKYALMHEGEEYLIKKINELKNKKGIEKTLKIKNHAHW